MRRYILEEKIDVSYNASSKARDDVTKFVCTYQSKDGLGYSVIGHNNKTNIHSNIKKVLIGVEAVKELLLSLKKDDILFIQSSFKILRLVDAVKRIIRFRTIYLIHDIDALRVSFNDYDRVKETIDALNKQDVVIAHNDKMIIELKRRGCTVPLVSLDIFDYFTERERKEDRDKKMDRVCFAGNLNPKKTHFLYALDESEIQINLNVYGKKEADFKRLNYCGCYEPELLPEKMEGEYGLIWEGDDFCYKESDNPYIMYNNPHKASLYIVSCLPIIIWEKAAIADYIVSRGIGITIGSLDELPERLSSISSEEYRKLMSNIRKERKELITGKHIHRAISSAEKYLL